MLSLVRHPVEQLWEEMHSFVLPFPTGVVSVPEPVRGTAFFPGGLGLWMEEGEKSSQFPAGQIMVVGQDFNSSVVYERVRCLGTEVDLSATWRGLRPLLAASNVSPDRCFFTNVYRDYEMAVLNSAFFPAPATNVSCADA